MQTVEQFKNKVIEKIDEKKNQAKMDYGKISELAELIGDTNEYVDSPNIREKVLLIIPEREIDRYRGMNREQLTTMAESFHGLYRGLCESLNAIYDI